MDDLEAGHKIVHNLDINSLVRPAQLEAREKTQEMLIMQRLDERMSLVESNLVMKVEKSDLHNAKQVEFCIKRKYFNDFESEVNAQCREINCRIDTVLRQQSESQDNFLKLDYIYVQKEMF